MESIWNDGCKIKKFDSLIGEVKTDVLIIGGGICGILCAYMLKNAGIDCIVAEADKICRGVTNGTTAKITLQHGLIYDKIINKYGVQKAELYYKSQSEALENICNMAKEIDCDFENCSSIVYSKNNREIIEKEVLALEKIGAKAEFTQKTELPFEVSGAVKIENQARFNPLKFIFDISKNLNIYENTKVLKVMSNCAVTNRGKIQAKKIIVATHFPFIDKHGAYFMKLYQHRSYVLALKGAVNVENMYVDEAENGLSFRGYKDLLLLGGGSHRTGAKGGNWKELEKFSRKYYENSQIVRKWATQDCMTLDGIAYIGRYSKFTPDLYVATGFNKWGMTSSMTAAMLLADLVCEKENEYESLYSPQRTILHKQLAVNAWESVKGLIKPTVPRCPHMGCALKYNKAEHTWDCPCHGSRFEENGKLIDNPSNRNKKI